jgi:sugar lactone lactonase YvrE
MNQATIVRQAAGMVCWLAACVVAGALSAAFPQSLRGGDDPSRPAATHATRDGGPSGNTSPWLQAKAYAIPKETTNQGSGYFSIVCGLNNRLYIGTAKYGVNAYLVEFDPGAETFRIVVDCHREIGTTATGFAAQAKIHTRNNVGPSGKIYFATKQGYPEKGEKRTDYPGGYAMVYDPVTEKTRVYGIPVPHHGIISIAPDESRGVAYVSTCDDARPIESTHFLILDLQRGTYRDLLDCQHMYAFVVVDYLGRAYHPVLGGDIARYDPRSDKLERLRQTIDGKPPSEESLLAAPNSHPINWDISPDGKTLYAVAMSGNQLYAYDLTAEGDTLPGRSLGALVPGAKRTDCRALCVGPRGDVWAAVTADTSLGRSIAHLVHYRPGNEAPRVCGPIAIGNPDYTQFTDAEGKRLPWHHGVRTLADGTVTTDHALLGVCEDRRGNVYVLSLAPYTLLRIEADALRR